MKPFIPWRGEPQFHTGQTDMLPPSHPRADCQVHCVVCQTLVHAFNNECMTDWVEWRYRAMCLRCFIGQNEVSFFDFGAFGVIDGGNQKQDDERDEAYVREHEEDD